MKKILLPYYNERPKEIKALVLHCSMHSALDMVEVLRENKLSAHYVVGLDGEIIQLVEDENRAWHAGVSAWREIDNLNDCSIGIEISSMSMGQEEYSDKQIEALTVLCKRLIEKYEIPAQYVVAHSDVAPKRKPDPGKAFPWQKLAKDGIGLWYDLNDADNVSENEPEVLLKQIGYNTENLVAAEYAFCRHFIPQEVEKISDIQKLVDEVYPKDFVFKKEYMPILKACAYAFR